MTHQTYQCSPMTTFPSTIRPQRQDLLKTLAPSSRALMTWSTSNQTGCYQERRKKEIRCLHYTRKITYTVNKCPWGFKNAHTGQIMTPVSSNHRLTKCRWPPPFHIGKVYLSHSPNKSQSMRIPAWLMESTTSLDWTDRTTILKE